jgi:hypothetical protein
MKTLSLWVMWVAVVACVWGGFIDEDGYYLMDSLELSAFNGATSDTGTLTINGADGIISGISSANSWWLQFERLDGSKLPSDLSGAKGWKLSFKNTSPVGALQLILAVSTQVNGWQASSGVWVEPGQTGTVYLDIEGPEVMWDYWIIASVPADHDVLTFTALNVEDKSRPWNPLPKDDPGALNAVVLPEVVLQWNTAMVKDPIERPNPNVRKHYIFANFEAPDDPNLVYIGQVDAGDPVAPTARYPETGSLLLQPLTVYRWQVVHGLDDGQGGVLAYDDPNNIVGDIWTFKTASYEPVVTKNPQQYTAAFPGEEVVLTAEFFSLTDIADYQWFWSNDNGATYIALADGEHPSGSGSMVSLALDQTDRPKTTTLRISGVQPGDDGWYYCALSNVEGSGESIPAGVAVKRRVAYYPFDGTLEDASGENNHGQAGTADPSGTTDITFDAGLLGSAVVLNASYGPDDPNQSYIELPATGYPKAAPGGAMEAGTFICWIKTNDQGRIMGSLNSPGSTAFTAGVDNNVDVFIRDANGQVNEMAVNHNAADGQWHFVAARWEVGGTKRAYAGTLTENGISSAVQDGLNEATYATLQYPMLIGAQNNGGVPEAFLTNAMLDELQIFNYALSDEEIADIYNGVSARGLCAAEYMSQFDFTGDCIVGLADFAEFAAAWLSCGVMPDSACGL